jgi:hypothetical protein
LSDNISDSAGKSAVGQKQATGVMELQEFWRSIFPKMIHDLNAPVSGKRRH